MHGRKREDEAVTQTPEERRAQAEKIAKYNAAKTQLIEMRAARRYDATAYALSAKLIEINPDFYTLFNYRKEIVLDMMDKDPASKSALSATELELSQKALLRNPKCYGAWHHRLWVLDQGASDPQAELQVCGKMLEMDARNFHCWNYRRAVAARAHATPEDEFKFTTLKINENFSNYSAWHYRTKLVPRIYNHAWFQSGEGPEARRQEYDLFLDDEFTLVQQAFYTEPEDQSAWLYHRWLLGRVVATGATNQLPVLGISLGTHLFDDAQVDESTKRLEQADDAAATAASATLSPAPSATQSLKRHLYVFTREYTAILDLLSIEPDCKWALLTSALLQAGIIACKQQQAGESAEGDRIIVDQFTTNIQQIFERLVQLDPMRTNYYTEVRQKFLTNN